MENTITLPMYGGKRGTGTFRIMTVNEAKTLVDSHFWAIAQDGSAREVKRNGAVRTWKRDSNRVEIPFKYGLFEYGTFISEDVQSGKLLIKL